MIDWTRNRDVILAITFISLMSHEFGFIICSVFCWYAWTSHSSEYVRQIIRESYNEYLVYNMIDLFLLPGIFFASKYGMYNTLK